MRSDFSGKNQCIKKLSIVFTVSDKIQQADEILVYFNISDFLKKDDLQKGCQTHGRLESTKHSFLVSPSTISLLHGALRCKLTTAYSPKSYFMNKINNTVTVNLIEGVLGSETCIASNQLHLYKLYS